MDPVLAISDQPDPEAEAVIEDGLNRFNDAEVGYGDRCLLNVFARDPETGKILGGILGRTSLGLWFVELVFLPDARRGSGLGSKMLAAAEAEARRRSCRAGVLYTISFQAPGFYERNGWRRFGEIPCDPPGTSRVFMTKSLVEK